MIFFQATNDTDQSDSTDEPDPSPHLAGFFRPDHDPPLLNPQLLSTDHYSLPSID
jgi:hypothetical protein